MMDLSFPNRSRGFTLVELLVVFAIIIALSGLLIPSVVSLREASKKDETRETLWRIGEAILQYAEHQARSPEFCQVLVDNPPPNDGLAASGYKEAAVHYFPFNALPGKPGAIPGATVPLYGLNRLSNVLEISGWGTTISTGGPYLTDTSQAGGGTLGNTRSIWKDAWNNDLYWQPVPNNYVLYGRVQLRSYGSEGPSGPFPDELTLNIHLDEPLKRIIIEKIKVINDAITKYNRDRLEGGGVGKLPKVWWDRQTESGTSYPTIDSAYGVLVREGYLPIFQDDSGEYLNYYAVDCYGHVFLTDQEASERGAPFPEIPPTNPSPDLKIVWRVYSANLFIWTGGFYPGKCEDASMGWGALCGP